MNAVQKTRVTEAQHRIRATREKLGLKKVGNAQNDYSGLNGFFAAMMGGAKGLMYHEGAYSPCYSAIEGSLMSWDSFTVVFINIYMPWYWSDLQVVIMDTVTMSSDFYSSCDVDKLMTTCTKLITIEGATELASRAVGAIFFEYKDLFTAFKKDPETKKFINSAYQIGVFLGRAISVTLGWTI